MCKRATFVQIQFKAGLSEENSGLKTCLLLNQLKKRENLHLAKLKVKLKSFTSGYLITNVINAPLTPDRCHVKRPPPSLKITSNFLVFYGLSHDTTLKKKGVALF